MEKDHSKTGPKPDRPKTSPGHDEAKRDLANPKPGQDRACSNRTKQNMTKIVHPQAIEMNRKRIKTYPVLLTISLLLVAGSSAYMSVYGLMSVFMTHAMVVMCMGLGMEIGKILIVSYVYVHWNDLRSLARILYILIISVLVFLTSIEVMGFLSQSHTVTTRDFRTAETALKALRKEAIFIKEQLSIIDHTLAGLPVSHVSRRINERKAHGYNNKQSLLLDIAKRQAQLETKIVTDQGYGGPIFATARIMKINETKAIAIFILLLVMVLPRVRPGWGKKSNRKYNHSEAL